MPRCIGWIATEFISLRRARTKKRISSWTGLASACFSALLTLADKHGARLEAWAVFPNHYHFVAVVEGAAGTALRGLIRELHSRTAVALNRYDAARGRKIWHNYWDTRITTESSYFARLNYVHQNPVRHGLVSVAHDYPYGSADWLERTATPAQVQTIYSFKTDRVRVIDDF